MTYPNILKPGCQGCLAPHEWQHDEDCPGRSQAGGHRHAKDFFGTSLYIGDRVAAMVPSYRALGAATVVAITPKRIRVRWVSAVSSVVRAGDEFTTEENMVVKCRRQGP